MRIRRMLSNPKFAVDTPPTNVDITSPMPTVSTLSSPPVAPAISSATTSSSADGTSSSIAKPKLDAIRLTATGKAKEVSSNEESNKDVLPRAKKGEGGKVGKTNMRIDQKTI